MYPSSYFYRSQAKRAGSQGEEWVFKRVELEQELNDSIHVEQQSWAVQLPAEQPACLHPLQEDVFPEFHAAESSAWI